MHIISYTTHSCKLLLLQESLSCSITINNTQSEILGARGRVIKDIPLIIANIEDKCLNPPLPWQ